MKYLLPVGWASCSNVWWNKKNLIEKYLRLVLYPLLACVLQPRGKREICLWNNFLSNPWHQFPSSQETYWGVSEITKDESEQVAIGVPIGSAKIIYFSRYINIINLLYSVCQVININNIYILFIGLLCTDQSSTK